MNPSLLPSLAWFAHVAHYRSFTRAAEAMGVSRAALSQNLKELENKLGVKLLYRTTRDMSLTEAGQQLFDALQPSLGTIERALDNLNDTAESPSGLIRLNTSRLAAKALIETHLAEFYVRYPKVKLELIMDDSLSNIIADGCDVGIRLGRSLADHVIAVPISPPLSMMVVGSPSYLAQHGIPQTPDDLGRHNCINYRYTGTGAVREWDFSEANTGHFTQSVTGNFITNDSESMINAALQGVGLIQHLDIAIKPLLVDGRLVRVLQEWVHKLPGFYLYAPSREQMPAKVRALYDFLLEKREFISPE